MLYKKLVEIGKGSTQYNSINKTRTTYKKKKNTFVQDRIKSLAQENLFMLKRLLEKKSEYDKNKFQKEFEVNQRYKNNVCNYPSINFYSTKKGGPSVEG